MLSSLSAKAPEEATGPSWNTTNAPDSEVNFDVEKDLAESEVRVHHGIHLILLTIGFGGLQTVFALLSASGSSQLVSLGMEKYLVGITWLAGPLAGVFLQPYIGACSDRARYSYGRRRPYILGGTFVIVLGIMLLAHASGAAAALSCSIGHHSTEYPIRMFLAILGVFVINMGIQGVQVGLRALIVDTCVPQQQSQANAWAARTTGIGNIVGFLAGVIDLTQVLPLADQFSALSFLTCLFLIVTIGLSCWVATEDDPNVKWTERSKQASHPFRDIINSARVLPKEIKDVCFVQAVSWVGWGPFISYVSIYTSETYLQRRCGTGTRCDPGALTDEIWNDATRQGSSSMLIFAIVSLAATAVLPIAITSQERLGSIKKELVISKWALLQRHITIRNSWILSQALFGVCMIGMSLFPYMVTIKVFVGLLGLSWACTIWIPFALISTAISARNTKAYSDTVDCPRGLEPATVLAIHNVAISAPQAIAAILSSVVFWVSGSQSNGLAWILGIAGIFGFLAAWAARGLRTVTILDRSVGDEAILLMQLPASDSDSD